MAAVKYELATKVTRGDKERWQKIGVVFEGERGLYGIIDNVPVGFTGMVSFFEPKERQESQTPRKQSAELKDDMPW